MNLKFFYEHGLIKDFHEVVFKDDGIIDILPDNVVPWYLHDDIWMLDLDDYQDKVDELTGVFKTHQQLYKVV